MKSRPHPLQTAGLLSLLLAISGCTRVVDDGGGGGHANCDPPCYASLGWEAYEAQQWDQVYLFAVAASLDSTFGEAWMGLGWCHIEQGYIGVAQEDFQRAIDLDTSLVAAYAGNAYSLAASRNLVDALAMAQIALEKGGDDYLFEHNAAVTGNSLHVLLASIYFRVGDYGSAQIQVDIVAPGNGLNPFSPTYVQELMLLISTLGGQT